MHEALFFFFRNIHSFIQFPDITVHARLRGNMTVPVARWFELHRSQSRRRSTDVYILGNSAMFSCFFHNSPFAFIGLRNSLTALCPIVELCENCGTRSSKSYNNIRQVNGVTMFPIMQCKIRLRVYVWREREKERGLGIGVRTGSYWDKN